MIERRDLLGLMAGALASTTSLSAAAQYVLAPGEVRLIFNENPYGPSPKAIEAVKKLLPLTAYYPDSPVDHPIRDNLVAEIGQRNDLSADNVFICSGSNEGLQAAIVAYQDAGKILTPSLTYTDHLFYAETLGVPIDRVPLKDDLSIDLETMRSRVGDDTAMVYLANPNNPTGIPIDSNELRAFCRDVGKKALVVVDEAYNELTDNPLKQSMVDLVRDNENVLVMRTFSKIFGMAGMRVGYGMGHPDLVAKINSFVMSWPNGIGLAAAYHSYIDDEFIAFSRAKVLEGRSMVNNTLKRAGVTPVPSQTNFVFADIGRDAKAFAAQMAAKGVQIKGNVADYPTYIRVSMGKTEDLKVFDRVFTEVYT